jgi:hypothetical protein
MRLPALKLRGIVHADVLNGIERLGTANEDVAHVADIEDADTGADGHVLGDQAGVLDRHVPAAEIDHLGARLAMDSVQGSLTQRGIRFGGWTQRNSLAVRKVTSRAGWTTFESNTLIWGGSTRSEKFNSSAMPVS